MHLLQWFGIYQAGGNSDSSIVLRATNLFVFVQLYHTLSTREADSDDEV